MTRGCRRAGVSFAVLARVSIATCAACSAPRGEPETARERPRVIGIRHAVLNILRRVLVIGAAAAVFATPLSAANCPP